MSGNSPNNPNKIIITLITLIFFLAVTSLITLRAPCNLLIDGRPAFALWLSQLVAQVQS